MESSIPARKNVEIKVIRDNDVVDEICISQDLIKSLVLNPVCGRSNYRHSPIIQAASLRVKAEKGKKTNSPTKVNNSLSPGSPLIKNEPHSPCDVNKTHTPTLVDKILTLKKNNTFKNSLSTKIKTCSPISSDSNHCQTEVNTRVNKCRSDTASVQLQNHELSSTGSTTDLRKLLVQKQSVVRLLDSFQEPVSSQLKVGQKETQHIDKCGDGHPSTCFKRKSSPIAHSENQTTKRSKLIKSDKISLGDKRTKNSRRKNVGRKKSVSHATSTETVNSKPSVSPENIDLETACVSSACSDSLALGYNSKSPSGLEDSLSHRNHGTRKCQQTFLLPLNNEDLRALAMGQKSDICYSPKSVSKTSFTESFNQLDQEQNYAKVGKKNILVISPPTEYIHITKSGLLLCASVVKKCILELLQKNKKKIYLCIDMGKKRTPELLRKEHYQVRLEGNALKFFPVKISFMKSRRNAGIPKTVSQASSNVGNDKNDICTSTESKEMSLSIKHTSRNIGNENITTEKVCLSQAQGSVGNDDSSTLTESKEMMSLSLSHASSSFGNDKNDISTSTESKENMSLAVETTKKMKAWGTPKVSSPGKTVSDEQEMGGTSSSLTELISHDDISTSTKSKEITSLEMTKKVKTWCTPKDSSPCKTVSDEQELGETSSLTESILHEQVTVAEKHVSFETVLQKEVKSEQSSCSVISVTPEQTAVKAEIAGIPSKAHSPIKTISTQKEQTDEELKPCSLNFVPLEQTENIHPSVSLANTEEYAECGSIISQKDNAKERTNDPSSEKRHLKRIMSESVINFTEHTSMISPECLGKLSGSLEADSESNITSTNVFDLPVIRWTSQDVCKWFAFHDLGIFLKDFSELDGSCLAELMYCLTSNSDVLYSYLKDMGYKLTEALKLASKLRTLSSQKQDKKSL
ncbi:hypothetical protein BgiMline_025805 [Biomphalaria glabrata]|uniref:Uncharacterized protein LOC106061982 isoform X1 n=1 Tax=Biomphalaria glabrata TaxID=6526 RepID=A0A9W2YBX4_BIOGL|nr:uncharacterized protein LOC106061982 isoform X1 [Biomphalaria glabrata]KAI8743442.1 hypothetical protein BgiMline_021851 [Biomphalaria glabrata]